MYSCILFIHVLVSLYFLKIYVIEVDEFGKLVTNLPGLPHASVCICNFLIIFPCKQLFDGYMSLNRYKGGGGGSASASRQ